MSTSSVVIDISVSLDGYVTGPGPDLRNGLGAGGDVLHNWAREHATAEDREMIERSISRTGAVVMGRRTFDFVDGPHGWTDDFGYGAEQNHSNTPAVFVVTHSAPTSVRLTERFTFVTTGLNDTIEQARAAAGTRDVVVMGGGATAAGVLGAGLADILTLHVAPAILGAGTPLFAQNGAAPPIGLRKLRSVSTATADHLTYRILDG